MGQNEKQLESRIRELEGLLRQSQSEMASYRTEVTRLNEQLERLIGQIGQELKLAHLIQKALVPTEIPNIPGFDFSTKFVASGGSGGDYFDIFELEDKFRFAILVSSASGHGMSALFLSILLKLMSQTEARRGAPPHQVLQMMAQELIPNIQGDETASSFYAVIDRRSFDLLHCSAGIVSAFVYNFSQANVSRLLAQSPAFQKSFQSKFESHTYGLNPRDRIVVCSPGVTRATSEQGQLFGEERVIDIILNMSKSSPHELRNEILFQIQRFTGKEIPDKDVTVVVADVKDRVLKLARS